MHKAAICNKGYQMFFRRKQQMLICILAVALVGGFVLFRYLPQHRRIKAVEQARAAQAAAVAKTLAESSRLPEFKKQLLALEAAAGNYEARVPSHGELGRFLHQLTSLMNNHNLTEKRIDPGRQLEAEGLSCTPVSIECRGSLKQMFDFFTSLQALDRLVRIEQMSLKNDSDFGGKVNMQTQAVIYYRMDAG
jgi:Tfp pilus assembly protein PilO